VEFIRRNSPEFLGLTQPQLISVVMMIAGGVWLAVKARRGELIKAPPPGAQTAAIRTTA
jgi:prolipoprotein diacylglyceryltransferase